VKKRPAVLHFIDEERGKGTGEQAIRHKLLDAGWHMDIIHRAMGEKEVKSTHKKAAKRKNTRQTIWQKINPAFLVLAGLVVILGLALFI
jgi:SOS response regulatory protein OraA/RecX